MPSLPATMTAVEIAKPGGPEVLRPAERPVPQPGAGEVLVKVAAAGVNRPDVVQRQGNYAPPPGTTDIPGLEIAGTVVAAGPDVGADWVGRAVTALVAGGGYAPYCTAPVPQCLPYPAGFDALRAAALPETFFTVWSNVFDRGGLKPGERFLVHGGTSGIGTTAIQLAKAFGARVFATAGSAAKAQACRDLGADVAIDYRSEDFVAVVARETKDGVELILDMVGGSYTQRNLQALAPDGRLVQIAFLQGSKGEINLLPVMLKRLTITGSTLRPRSVAFKGAIARALAEKVWPLLAAGTVKPVIHKTFPLAEAAEAHRLMESSAHVGKIMLAV
ncbi:MAG: NAD(P)H-quinone oxidoreductase [Alphaproteobacteria bacterium]|nr:NAD(P)H-quinone oxidoreductase [Alphaproteobacteria bacterium]